MPPSMLVNRIFYVLFFSGNLVDMIGKLVVTEELSDEMGDRGIKIYH